jgi:hypothetical protein
MLLVKALAKTSSGSDLKEALIGLGPVNGLQTDLELNSYGDVDRGVYIKRFREGSFETVAEYLNQKKVSSPAQ